MFKTLSITLLGLLTVSAVRAQSSQPLEAKIPFDFTVKNTTLEAGTYRVSYSNVSHALRIQSLDNIGATVSVLAEVAMTPHSSSKLASTKLGELIFECNGDDCHLSRVWQGAAAGGAGLQILQARHKNATARASQPTLVTIPAE